MFEKNDKRPPSGIIKEHSEWIPALVHRDVLKFKVSMQAKFFLRLFASVVLCLKLSTFGVIYTTNEFDYQFSGIFLILGFHEWYVSFILRELKKSSLRSQIELEDKKKFANALKIEKAKALSVEAHIFIILIPVFFVIYLATSVKKSTIGSSNYWMMIPFEGLTVGLLLGMLFR